MTFHALHDKFGPIVRTAPNELSFIDPDALKTIYGERKKFGPGFRKNYDTFNETKNQIAHSVFIAGDEDHARMRKVISHAFSKRALQDQEPRIQSYAQTLVQRLDMERINNNGIVDLYEWYNCAAFDIIADTTFGEPFNTLDEPTYRPWLRLVEKTWKVITFASAVKSMAPPLYILRRMIPTGPMLQREVDRFNLVLNGVKRRLLFETGCIDLLSLIVKHSNEKERMTDQELIANATLFVAAGTETVTTLLSALTYLLTRNKRVMKRLTGEIRNSFSDEDLISIQSVSHLQYLTACIQEALRRFPPTPEGLPRVVPPEGEEICGHWIPGGVCGFLFASCRSCFSLTAFSDICTNQQSRSEPVSRKLQRSEIFCA